MNKTVASLSGKTEAEGTVENSYSLITPVPKNEGTLDALSRVSSAYEFFDIACNELKEKQDPDYLSFIQKYEPAKAQEMVSQLWHFIMSMPEPFAWLKEKTENVPVSLDRDHPWFRTVSRMVKEKILTLRVILREQAEMFDEYEHQEAFRPAWIDDQAAVEDLWRWQSQNPNGFNE